LEELIKPPKTTLPAPQKPTAAPPAEKPTSALNAHAQRRENGAQVITFCFYPHMIDDPRWCAATIFATLRRVVWITRPGLPRCSILERPMPFAAFSSMHRDDGGGNEKRRCCQRRSWCTRDRAHFDWR